ncbi:MAG: hypothetical protein CMM50_07020 [Rhodospirillaceae bacterium]|nr:hypothetical protein [Rhodospirillaceae bacterium]
MSHRNSFRPHASLRNAKGSSPFSLRLSEAERARLEQAAAGLPLGTYIRSRIFDSKTNPHRTRGKAPVQDHKALAQLLGMLGSSRLSDSMNELAGAARVGALPLDPDTVASLQNACADVARMKRLLMDALGIRER